MEKSTTTLYFSQYMIREVPPICEQDDERQHSAGFRSQVERLTMTRCSSCFTQEPATTSL